VRGFFTPTSSDSTVRRLGIRLPLLVVLWACGDGVGSSVPATGFWYFNYTFGLGDSTCSMAQGHLVIDDSAGTFRAAIDGWRDCHMPGAEGDGARWLGADPDVVLTDGTVSMTAFSYPFQFTLDGEYSGNRMRGALTAVIPVDGLEFLGQWSAERDTDAERTLERLQGRWAATSWLLGASDLVEEGYRWELTFDGRGVYSETEADGYRAAGHGVCVIRERVLWFGRPSRDPPYAIEFPSASRVVLRRSSEPATTFDGLITFERQDSLP
jgi:hypothetical protein